MKIQRIFLIAIVASIVALSGALLGVSLSKAQTDCRVFPETGYEVCGKFLDYWNEHGGLAQQGYPLSEEFVEVSDLDGLPYTVQYFERAVFEDHPENQPPYDVLLSQLGTLRGKEKYPTGFPKGSTVPFLEDRQDAANFIQSFYNAINRQEYGRAYSYFDKNVDKQPYADFVKGYSDTVMVTVYTGKVEQDAGAGNVYASVPTVLSAQHKDGSVHTFYGCYILHHTNPGVDPDPNAADWKIQKATLAEDTANTPVSELLAKPCGQ